MTSEKLFSIVFGSSWVVAGSYARILSIATAFQFALTPLDKGAIVLGKSHYVLVWNGLRLACLLGLGLFARAAKPSVETVLWTLAIINIMLYSLDAIIGYGFAKLGQVQDSGKSDQLKLQTPA
jgi:O-antigen/teichoic acid export membrane protein